MHQYQATALGGPFTLATVPKPIPGPGDLLIRTKAVGLNPADVKMLYNSVMITSWPVVLGHESAGVVESVGEAVTELKPGDEVFGFTSWVNGRIESAAAQEFLVAPQKMFGKKPANLSFEEAAGLPITWTTAAAAITKGLGVPLPGLGNSEVDTKNAPTSILVVGGSSGCGAHAVQLLRFALGKSVTVVTTSSPQHHSSLQAIGASSCIARADQGNVDVLKAASPDAAGYDALIDCVGAVAEQPQILDALKDGGKKLFAQVHTGAQIKVPEGVNHEVVWGMNIFDTDGGENTMPYLATLFNEGKLQLPIKVDVGKGYDAIGKGIERLHNGVSGIKLVVSL
ncbi:hypothetical protein N0V93_007863 [Gnomoniopsis smithogilvyi]|uniref:Enoyl reductase (ER) domain-containing protein n=1 Tax=Gnomoniopsis smithogilvyi TaxID=1191159 RepID=A0A9W9CUC0_9PEZI|nr:hypothetical protein N0V93_007863 [Gnomoniopsis smithogilvyi]